VKAPERYCSLVFPLRSLVATSDRDESPYLLSDRSRRLRAEPFRERSLSRKTERAYFSRSRAMEVMAMTPVLMVGA
jgi:hypothetical protein